MKRLAPFLVMLAGCLWATLGLFVRHFNDVGLTSMEILEARNILSAAALFLFLGLFRRELLRVRAKDMWCFAGGGIGSVILFNYCYFQTIQRSSLSVAAILLYTSPIFVLLLSVPLFGEKLTKKKVFCLIMAFTGCALAGGLASPTG
ncbi:MAG: DMT family transporter [Clostridiaceae bacterium]|nr:DMT family transporter [Clostridiaceae bacterium]